MPALALPHPRAHRAARPAMAALIGLLLALLLAACGGGGTVPTPGVQARALSPEFASRKAVAYSPFRTANRDTETITPAMIREDLALLAQGGFTLLRVFDSSDAVARQLLEVITQDRLDFKVMLGAYILSESGNGLSAAQLANNRAFNLAEVERAVALANAYKDLVLAVSVGNETMVVWSFVQSSPEVMAGYITAVRDRITQPVTTDDNWAFFARNASERYDPKLVLQAVDFVSMHTYPLLDTVPPAIANWDWQQQAVAAGSARATAMMDAAIAAAKAEYAAVRSHMDSQGFANKPIVVGETGWKADPAGGEFNRAHPVNQKMYFDRLTAWAAQGKAGNGPLNIVYFEAFDEPWKARDDKWGLFTVGRKARYMVQSLYPRSLWDTTYTDADAVYAATVSSSTITASRYTVYADTVTAGESRVSNLQFFGWDSPATAFSGEATETAPADPERARYLEIAPSPAVYGWGFFGTYSAQTDLSLFESTGRLNFRIRTTYPGKLRAGFFTGSGASGYDVYVTLSNTNADGHGYVNDGQWHDVSIPMSALKAAGAPAFGNSAPTARFDLTRVTQPFVINDVYDATGNTARGNTTKVYVDNIHWTR